MFTSLKAQYFAVIVNECNNFISYGWAEAVFFSVIAFFWKFQLAQKYKHVVGILLFFES